VPPEYNLKVNHPSYKRLNLALAPEQYAALEEKAALHGLSVQGLIRKGITLVTDVPDPIRSNQPRRDRT
jgi:predicted DNA binding CopG/RHH family protein